MKYQAAWLDMILLLHVYIYVTEFYLCIIILPFQLSCLFQKVWDKGENGQWHCTASWKVSNNYTKLHIQRHLLASQTGTVSTRLASFSKLEHLGKRI